MSNHTHRGNTLILVAGILALLVVIATAFVTRTQGGRVTGQAVQKNDLRGKNADLLARMLADEITSQLFTRPVSLNDPAAFSPGLGGPDTTIAANSNIPRLQPRIDAVRYAIDRETDRDRNGSVDTFPVALSYNQAPFEVVPFTNWPDGSIYAPGTAEAAAFRPLLPYGPGNPDVFSGAIIPGVTIQQYLYNPPGNPGFGDSRWLSSFEPERWNTLWNEYHSLPLGFFHDELQQDAFSHWGHMSYIGTANNGFRVIVGIDDIGDQIDSAGMPGSDGWGQLVLNLTIPIEQWATWPAARYMDWENAPDSTLTGDSQLIDFSIYAPGTTFENQWLAWCGMLGGGLNDHLLVYADTSGFSIPANWYRFSDLDADAVAAGSPDKNEDGHLPTDEFIRDTPRWRVGRMLADADGDGFTDSFWWIAPTATANGEMQIIAVRIVDNSAMLNVNAATRVDGQVAGETPTDLALFGPQQILEPINPVWSSGSYTNENRAIGLIDNPHNWFKIGGLAGSGPDGFGGGATTPWTRFATNAGITFGGDSNDDVLNYESGFARRGDPILSLSRHGRLEHWNKTGRRPFEADGDVEFSLFPNRRSTPFGIDDEVELRSFHGNSYNWNFTRLEQALSRWGGDGTVSDNNAIDILRARNVMNESAEMDGFQKTARMLLRDPRHRMTVYNGARNEMMPPYLWSSIADTQILGLGALFPLTVPGVESAEITEMLLRRKFDLRAGEAFPQTDRRELALNLYLDEFATTFITTYNDRRRIYRSMLRERLTDVLVEQDAGYIDGPSAMPQDNLDIAAHYAANILAYRSGDERANKSHGGLFATGDWFGNGLPYPDRGDMRNIPEPYSGTLRDGNDPAFLSEAIPIRDDAPGVTFDGRAAVGLEKQPFLLEAFVGHFHASKTLPPPPDGSPPRRYVDYAPPMTPATDVPDQTTVMVVQIANPFDEPIDLRDYKIRAFGQDQDLAAIVGTRYLLQPGTEWYPRVATFVSLNQATTINSPFPPDLGDRILDYLDITPPPGSISALHEAFEFDSPNFDGGNDNEYRQDDAEQVYLVNSWSTNRTVYDEWNQLDSVQLIRKDESLGAGTVDFVVDRFREDANTGNPVDSTEANFAQQVRAIVEPPQPNTEPDGTPWGIRFTMVGHDTLVQWVRVTRAWGYDYNAPACIGSSIDADIGPSQRNPRYVFSIQEVSDTSDALSNEQPKFLPFVGLIGAFQPTGDTFEMAINPDDWPITRNYINAYGQLMANRKVTFFNMKGGYLDCDDSAIDPITMEPYASPWADKGFYGYASDFTTNMPPQVGERLLTFPMQMMVKNADFQQLGELLNVWMYGHTINAAITGGLVTGYSDTEKTFSEHMAEEIARYEYDINNYTPATPEGVARIAEIEYARTKVNRLHVEPFVTEDLPSLGGRTYSPVAGLSSGTYDLAGYYNDGAHAVPDLPIGARIFDAFVLDARGVNDARFDEVLSFNGDNPDGYGIGFVRDYPLQLAGGFRGEGTQALLNLSTAPLEVLRTLPNWTKLVHGGNFVGAGGGFWQYPFTQIAESVVQYRNRFDGAQAQGALDPSTFSPALESLERVANAPDFGSGPLTNVLRNGTFQPNALLNLDRSTGFKSIGELMLMTQSGSGNLSLLGIGQSLTTFDERVSASNNVLIQLADSWRIDFAAANPYDQFAHIDFMTSVPADWQGSWLGTDVVGPNLVDFQPNLAPNNRHPSGSPGGYGAVGDGIASDVEESNLLFAGASNLVTTRSDVFTVYFKVRTFRQNPQTGVWDATDPDNIIDDSRYVMMVDRTKVDHPTDKPRIVYFEELPY